MTAVRVQGDLRRRYLAQAVCHWLVSPLRLGRSFCVGGALTRACQVPLEQVWYNSEMGQGGWEEACALSIAGSIADASLEMSATNS